jgi:hypothetical protein
LLIHACNFISKEQNESRILDVWSTFQSSDDTPLAALAESDEMTSCKAYDNCIMYRYLLDCGLEIEDCMMETGMTPLLAVCSEGLLSKIDMLLQRGGLLLSLYRKTKEGVDVWYWAEEYKYRIWPFETFPRIPFLEIDNEINYRKRDTFNVNTDHVDEYQYPLKSLLLQYEDSQTRYWKEILENLETKMTLLRDIPMSDLLRVLAKI